MVKYRGPLCQGDNINRWLWDNEPYDEQKIQWHTFCYGRPDGVKHPYVRCPICGRRVRLSISVTHDGDFVGRIPPHKPKGWWKKRKKDKQGHPMGRKGRK